MKAITSGALIALLGISCAAAESVTRDPLAPLDAPSPPAPAPVKPVTETLWGKQVTDNYRYMEALDPQTIAWMKAQSAHTRSILDAIPPRAALEAKIAAFTGSFGFTRGYVSYGGRAFYEERTPGSDNFDLVVRDKAGKRKIVDVAALRASNGGTPHAINYFLASPDGSKVAAGISQGGSEAASIFVYDTATGKQIAGPLDRADPGFTTWSNDSSTLYFARLKKLAPGEADIEKYRNPTLVSWDLKSEPVAVLGSTVGHGPSFLPDELPTLSISPGAPMAMAVSINGVQNELALWLAPVSQVNDPNVKWTPFVTRADDVTAADAAGDTIYLLSHKNAPTFQVLSVNAGQPLAAARVLVPAEKDRVIDSIHAASDALYVLARHGAYSLLLRVPYAAGKIEEVALPFKGLIREAFTDPRQPGITIDLQSFVVPPTTFAYDPEKKTFTDLELGVTPHYDSGRYEISDLEARAEDGVMVPNTLVRPKGAKGPQIVLIQAYGSYGISQLANFSLRTVKFPRSRRHLCLVPCARRRRIGRCVAPRRQGREQAKHLARPHRLRRRSHRARLHDERQALYFRRLCRRHHHGTGAYRAAGPVRGRDRYRSRRQHAALGIPAQRSAQHSGVRNHQDRGGFQEPLRDGHDPACAPRCSISTGADHDGPERPACLVMGTGEAHRSIASIGNGAPDPAAHRRGSGARHRKHQVAG